MGQQYGFYFDATRCTGCKTCVMACKDYNNLMTDEAYRQVFEISGGDWEEIRDGVYTHHISAYYISLACNHCMKPVCTEVCPTGAMSKGDFGLVKVDDQKCIGCGYCEMSCPYHAPRVDWHVRHSVKCDGCFSRVVDGKMPVCVEACPLRALDFGPIDILAQKYGNNSNIHPLPDSSITVPNIIIKRSKKKDLNGVSLSTLQVVNTREII